MNPLRGFRQKSGMIRFEKIAVITESTVLQ